MSNVTDAFGEYEATLDKCGCIDKRTLSNIKDSLRILYRDQYNERELEKEEKKGTYISNIVLKRTESLQDTVNSIKICEDHPEISVIKKTCVCKHPMEEIDRLSSELLRDIELYKDIGIGRVKVRKGVTPIEIIERIEDTVKGVIVQNNEYDRCCHPEEKIPEISKERLKGKSIIERIESAKRAIMTEEFKPIKRV